MTVEVPRAVLRNIERLYFLLSASPNAGRVVLDFARKEASGHQDADSYQYSSDDDNEICMMKNALDALASLRHPLRSLAVLNMSAPLALPSATTMTYLATCGLTELELHDVSIHRASSDGASNLLRSPPTYVSGQLLGESLADSIRARGSAMVQFACSFPSLRCLSLCNAAFSSSDVAALSVLTQLEELSVTGAMECGGGLASPRARSSQRSKHLGASAAAPSYKQLLASLPRLRQLRLPMAIAAPLYMYQSRYSGSGWDSEDCEDNADHDDDYSIDGLDDDCGTWQSPSHTNMGCLSDVIGSAYTEVPSCSSGIFAASYFDMFLTSPGPVRQVDCSPLSSFESGGFEATAEPVRDCCDYSSTGNLVLRDGPRGRWYGGLFDDQVLRGHGGEASHVDSQALVMAHTYWPLTTTSAAATTPCIDLTSRKWSFPPQLEELTIPLCFLNGAVFRAACAAYGSRGGAGPDEGATHRCLRSLHISCAPGYTMWGGSFLINDRDFAALARLAPTLESLHLSLELGGSGRNALRKDCLRECLRHLRALHKLQELRIEETRQPVCFSTRRNSAFGVESQADLLYELFAEGFGITGGEGYARKREELPPLVLPLVPRLGSAHGVSVMERVPGSGCSSSPTSSRSSSFTAAFGPFGPGVSIFSAAPKPALLPATSSCDGSTVPCLDPLLKVWPQLRFIVICGQGIVRSSGGDRDRLVRPMSVEQLSGGY